MKINSRFLGLVIKVGAGVSASLQSNAMPSDHMSQADTEVAIESLYATKPEAVRALKEALSQYRKYLKNPKHIDISLQNARKRLEYIGGKIGLSSAAIDGMLYWASMSM